MLVDHVTDFDHADQSGYKFSFIYKSIKPIVFNFN